MGISYNPSTVIDGLVLCYDAANPRSYSGSGSTIYDISGNGYNGTFSGGVSYSSGTKSLAFNGTDGRISFNNPLNQANLEQTWTVMAWINITDKVSQTLVGGLNLGCDVCYTAGNNSLMYLNSAANDYYMYGEDLGNVGWTLATFRFRNSDATRTIYRDKSNISTSGANLTSTPSGQNSTFYLGFGGSGYLEGNVGPMMIYKRYISDAELAQNFNALRGRYGI